MNNYDWWFLDTWYNWDWFTLSVVESNKVSGLSYYEEIVKEISQLIRKYPQCKDLLVKHNKRFMEMVDAYESKFKKLRERKKRTHLPENFPPDPRDWFIMKGRLPYLHMDVRKNISLQPEQTRPPSDEEPLMCCYVRLLIIHDCLSIPPSPYTPIYFNPANSVPGRYLCVGSTLWGKITYTNLEVGTKIEKEAKDLANEALAAVISDLQQQAGLAEQPAETNSQQGKFGFHGNRSE